MECFYDSGKCFTRYDWVLSFEIKHNVVKFLNIKRGQKCACIFLKYGELELGGKAKKSAITLTLV